jgi:hypothetical protein
MVNKTLLTVISVFCFLQMNYAQLHGDRAMDMPRLFIKPNVNTKFEDAFKPAISRTWVVYSDRQNNLAKTAAYGNLIRSALPFLEAFYVSERKGDYLRISKDAKLSDQGIFSESAEDFGWVHSDQLLLSGHCLVNDLKQPIKAVVANVPVRSTTDENNQTHYSSDTIPVFYDPFFRYPSEKKAVHHEIYYVYKIGHEAVLIGYSERLSPSEPSSAILGWIPVDNILLWDNRIALEPNRNYQAAGERKYFRIPAQLFYDPISALIYGSGRDVVDDYIIWKEDYSDNRPLGDALRFPVLGINGNLLKVGIWGSFESSTTKDEYRTSKVETLHSSNFINFSSIDDRFFDTNRLPQINLQFNDHFYTEAFTTLTNNALDYPVFVFVYLLSRAELANIINTFDAITSGSGRRHVQTQLLDLAIKIMPEYEPEQILDMKADELLPLILNVPVGQNYFQNKSLSDLNRPWRFSENDLNSFLKLINQKNTNLKSILNHSNYPYSFSSNGQVYYWIEKDALL